MINYFNNTQMELILNSLMNSKMLKTKRKMLADSGLERVDLAEIERFFCPRRCYLDAMANFSAVEAQLGAGSGPPSRFSDKKLLQLAKNKYVDEAASENFDAWPPRFPKMMMKTDDEH